MADQVKKFALHNIKTVESKGAKVLVTSCPSCFHTWAHEYEELTGEKIPFEILHISQYLARLIDEGKIKLGPVNAKVTYHDPCDLGRNSGIFEEPRKVITSIPGVDFVELPGKKLQANCCGGGGNLESLNPGLAAKIADCKADEIYSTGAEIAVSTCQQCERTMNNAIRKKKNESGTKVKVADLSELVLQSMESGN
jgi:Fe-S oxidoreductase